MDKARLQRLGEAFCDNSPTNFLSVKGEDAEELRNRPQAESYAKHNLQQLGGDIGFELLGAEKGSDQVGMRFYQKPIFSVGLADDPGFLELQKDGVVGSHHKLPQDWLPGAKRVISAFLPFETRVLESNKKDPEIPSLEWVMTRVDGQQHLLAFGAYMRDLLIEAGYQAVTPQLEDAFIMHSGPDFEDGIPGYSSNWSERHVGYVTGLGTFGLSTNFISKAGCAGRLVSIVTDWEGAPDVKDYSDWLGYCNECKACYRRCHGNAYTGKGIKDHALCGAQIRKAIAAGDLAPRYGCGKCQSGIPCESKPMIKR
ncbi:MAG: epoxyqueuosine reductase [Oscillospiraceae bacterium]|nr:epoxyqueuosine reductase [Oscillospiraceae bacterium]